MYTKKEQLEQIRMQCRIRGTTIKALEESLGYSSGTTITQTLKALKLATSNVGAWKAGRAPSLAVAMKLADHMSISAR